MRKEAICGTMVSAPPTHTSHLRCVEAVGELHREVDVQVALHERAAVDGHALVVDALEGVGLDDLAGGRAHSKDAAVEVLEAERCAAQRVRQADLFLWVGGRQDGAGRSAATDYDMQPVTPVQQ